MARKALKAAAKAMKAKKAMKAMKAAGEAPKAMKAMKAVVAEFRENPEFMKEFWHQEGMFWMKKASEATKKAWLPHFSQFPQFSIPAGQVQP